MDIIAFNEASTANGRIENFIENPDSTSGVLTVPKVIAAGETITIPAGRVAILPDLQVDGDLVVDGDLFIPTGSMTSQVVQKVTSTDNAVVRFNGVTGQVQNSGVVIDDNNNVTVVNQTAAGLVGVNTGITNPIADTRLAQIVIGNTTSTASVRIAGYTDGNWSDGVSSPTSLRLYTTPAGSNAVTERMRIDSAGNVGIGKTPNPWRSDIKVIENIAGVFASVGSTDSALIQNATLTSSGWIRNSGLPSSMYEQANGGHYWSIAPSGTAGNTIAWNTAMTLVSTGQLLLGTNSVAGFQNANCIVTDTSAGAQYNNHSGTVSGTVYHSFGYNGAQIGGIYQSGTTAVTYNTTSDYRLKENIRPADCKRFIDIKFVDYERIDGRHECGVIAHELQEVYPDLVTGEKDATEIRKVEISPAVEEVKDEDGNIIVEAVEAVYEEQEFPVYQQVNYMGLIARIGTVVQQQAKLIEAMQLEINELKGAK